MLAAFLRMLRQPSSFEAKPYEWATNQISHAMFVGFGAATFFSLVALKASGVWPEPGVTFACVVLTYAAIWERAVQGWRGIDSLADSVFVAYGAAAFIAIDMQYVIERIAIWYVGLGFLLAPRISKRILQGLDE